MRRPVRELPLAGVALCTLFSGCATHIEGSSALWDKFKDDFFPVLEKHNAILREADLIEGSKSGTVITYMLKISVLEEALLAFAETVGIGLPKPMSLKKATGKAK